jgi:hypothetical protein
VLGSLEEQEPEHNKPPPSFGASFTGGSGSGGSAEEAEAAAAAAVPGSMVGAVQGWFPLRPMDGCPKPRGEIFVRLEVCFPRDGESKRLVVGSPRSQFTSECQRFGHPPRLDKVPF